LRSEVIVAMLVAVHNGVLFLISVLIWGSTWLAITFQMGKVERLLSVAYRFALASLILFVWCLFRGRSLRFGYRQHAWMAAQGILLYGVSYWLTYLGVAQMTSALAAVLSTSIVYFNVLLAHWFLGDPIRKTVLVGAAAGVTGKLMIFWPELRETEKTPVASAIFFVLLASFLASAGNVMSAKTQRLKLPVLQANAFGMGYAALLLLGIGLLLGYPLTFDWRPSYLFSLLYLALFGSVIAFGAFLTLLGRIGPDKAGYATFVYPVVALILSSLFEDYRWTLSGAAGLIMILLGNVIAMEKYPQMLAWFATLTQSFKRKLKSR